MAIRPGSRLNARGRSPQRRCRVTGVFGSGFLTERTCQRLTEAASAAAFGRGCLEHGNHGGSAGRVRTTPVSTADLGMHSFSSRNRPVPVGRGEPLDGSPGVADLSLADPEPTSVLRLSMAAVHRAADVRRSHPGLPCYELSEVVQASNVCGLGETAPYPVLSKLRCSGTTMRRSCGQPRPAPKSLRSGCVTGRAKAMP